MFSFNISIPWALITTLVLIGIYRYIIKGLLKMLLYRKQGLKIEFFPLLGSLLVKMIQSQKQHNDAIYDLKVYAQRNTQERALVRNIGSTHFVMLLDPTLKKEFAFHHNSYAIKEFPGTFGKLFTAGLTGASGDEWKKQRKIISQSFHFEFIKESIPLMIDTTRELLNDLEKKDLNKIEMLAELETIAGENIGRSFFSQRLKNYSVKGETITACVMSLIVKLKNSFLSPGAFIFGPKFVEKGFFKADRDLIECWKDLENVCKQILEELKSSKAEKKDLAWYLLESQKNPAEEDRLSDEAGTNTMSTLLVMTLYELTRNPEMLDKLRQEILEIYDQEEHASIESLNKMDWLTSLLKETLRLYNPVGVGAGSKQAIEDHIIGDIKIQKGAVVMSSFIDSQFDPKYFEEPLKCHPQRWADKTCGQEPYVYTPFWAGPRNCIGQHFAMIEAKVILCEFVKKFDFSLKDGYKLTLSVNKAYGPTDDMPMHLKVRNINV